MPTPIRRSTVGKWNSGSRPPVGSPLEATSQASQSHVNVSLATIYNTLHQFHEAGLLREVAVDASRSYFDTDTSDHHHFYVEDEQRMIDIPASSVEFMKLR